MNELKRVMPDLKFARIVFGISVVALGLQHFIVDHVSVTKPSSTSFVGGLYLFVGFLYAMGLVTFSAAILFNYKIRLAAFSLGVMIFIWALFRHFPLVVTNITDPGELNAMFMAVAASGGAFILTDSIGPWSLSDSTYLILNRKTINAIGNCLYGLGMIVFGVQHIAYASFIASLIPTWIPGNYFWAYSTGLALIGAGVSISLRWKSKIASLALGIMISLWIVLLHVPRIQANPGDHYEWTNLFQASIIAATAFALREKLTTVEEPITAKALGKTVKVRKRWQQRYPRPKESEV